MFSRDQTRMLHVGGLPLGGGAPVSVQTMATADPHDAAALAAQIARCAEAGADYEESYVRDFVLRTSVNDLLRQVAEEKQLAFGPLKAAFNARSDSRWASIQAIPHARETLAALQAAGCRSFVYTHRGASSFSILGACGCN